VAGGLVSVHQGEPRNAEPSNGPGLTASDWRQAAPSKASQEPAGGRVQVPQTQQNAHHIGPECAGTAMRAVERAVRLEGPNSHSWRPPYPRTSCVWPPRAPTTHRLQAQAVPVFGGCRWRAALRGTICIVGRPSSVLGLGMRLEGGLQVELDVQCITSRNGSA